MVIVAKDGQTMYPDVNDNNSAAGPCDGPVISWPDVGQSADSQSADGQPEPLVHISLLSAEDGKGDIARYCERYFLLRKQNSVFR
jgi:hypothetical protein